MFKMQMTTSCGWKMSMSPSLRQSAGSALDRVRCVGHSPIHRHGDTIRNVAKTVSKEKMKMVNLFIGLPSAFLFAMSYGGPFAPKKKKKWIISPF